MRTEYIGNLELRLCDNMVYIAECPDKHFDLAIVDPPYGIGTHCIKNNKNRTKLAIASDIKPYKNNKSDRPSREYFSELERVSKNRIVWGGNHLCDLFDARGTGWIVWDKEATGSFSDGELAYSSFDRSLQIFHYPWNGMIQGYHGDKRLNEKRIHPSQKPVQLYRWLLQQYALPGQRILDTHLGSGSHAVAAHYFGVDFVGLEKDPDYFDAMIMRVTAETAQIGMAL